MSSLAGWGPLGEARLPRLGGGREDPEVPSPCSCAQEAGPWALLWSPADPPLGPQTRCWVKCGVLLLHRTFVV